MYVFAPRTREAKTLNFQALQNRHFERILTFCAFFAPTLARCTISFLSPSCIPFRPAHACQKMINYFSENSHATRADIGLDVGQDSKIAECNIAESGNFVKAAKLQRFRSPQIKLKQRVCKAAWPERQPMNWLTWSVMFGSTYSQKAYPFDSPVALSLTRLNAFNGPNDVNSSLTCKTQLG